MVSLKASPTTSSSHIVSLLTFLQTGSINHISLATSLLLILAWALNDLRTVARLLDTALIDWIPNKLIPLYTVTILLYLSLRYLHDESVQRKKKEIATNSASIAVAPSLLSTTAIALKEGGPPPPIDLSGCYNLTENHNFEALLQAQGVPWFLVSAANKARPTHRITQDGCHIKIKIEGIIESETMYIVGGPPVETILRRCWQCYY
jgi:hypothetical protein